MSAARRVAEIAPHVMNAFHDLGHQHPRDEKLSMRQFQVLIILNASRTLTLSQLCEKLSLAPSTGTELVNRMIQLGFIQKAPQAKDLRQMNLNLTERGAELLKQRQEALTKMFENFINPFTAEEKEKFVQSFETILNLITKYHTSPQPNQ